jgi:hypothetical protein
MDSQGHPRAQPSDTHPPIPATPWLEHDWVPHTQLLLDSYARWLGCDLIPRGGAPEDEARRLFEANRVVVSHGIQDDPLLNYANRQALDLWEMEIDQLRRTPSRLTAEAMHRDERAQLLAETSLHGFVDGYRGIRISRTGRRFLIERATVWNLVDRQQVYRGQAATFSDWRTLEEA